MVMGRRATRAGLLVLILCGAACGDDAADDPGAATDATVGRDSAVDAGAPDGAIDVGVLSDVPASDVPAVPVGFTQKLVADEAGITDVAILGDAITFGTAPRQERTGRIARITRTATGWTAARTLVAGQDVLSLAVNPARVFWFNGRVHPVISQYLEADGTAHRFFPPRDGAWPMDRSEQNWNLLADTTHVYFYGWNLVRLRIADLTFDDIPSGPNTTIYALSEDEIFTTGCRSGSLFLSEFPKVRGDWTMTMAPNCLGAMAATREFLVVAPFGQGLQVARVNGAPRPLGQLRPLANIGTESIVMVPPYVVAAANGTLVRVALTDGAVVRLVAAGVNTTTRLAADEVGVAWIAADASAVSYTRVK
jgi:hypothetical protein